MASIVIYCYSLIVNFVEVLDSSKVLQDISYQVDALYLLNDENKPSIWLTMELVIL